MVSIKLVRKQSLVKCVVILGWSEKPFPASMLSHIQELAGENDESCRQLLDFLEKHGLSTSSKPAEDAT